MKFDSKIGVVIGVAALLVAILGTGIAFAAYNRELTIDGTADVGASNWDIKFKNLQAVTLVGEEAEEITAPTINTNDTNIGDYDVKFVVPGSSATYVFDVANDGTYDSIISNIVIPTPTCTGNGDNATTDATNVCNHLSYTLTYTDSGETVKVGDTLPRESSKSLTLKLEYKDTITAEELPKDDVAIDNLGITILYVQD